ncbi:uncharacterized protein LOC141892409 isoform X3 [Acropora palmata]|uniref:uncharacterized protein LOC141892409 isoform X3 n=1 Tax=Acropora palmata TaxID=6131 RepID=UPI003DA0353E
MTTWFEGIFYLKDIGQVESSAILLCSTKITARSCPPVLLAGYLRSEKLVFCKPMLQSSVGDTARSCQRPVTPVRARLSQKVSQ